MRVLDKGGQSHVDEARQVVARTSAEWDALWRLHAPDRPQPKVDLTREMVVAVFLGSRPTAGFEVEITGWSEKAGALIVQYREARPPRDAITAQVITSPCYVAALPRFAGEVRFERTD